MKIDRIRTAMPVCLFWISLGLLAAGACRSSAAEAFLPLRLGEVKPEGWLRAVLQRDLISGYAGHLDDLLRDPRSKKYLLQPKNNDYVTRA
jgi:hypothetical protein